MADANRAIEVCGLSKSFGRRFVLRDVAFDVAAGQVVAITGANGAGKTTLLRCLASITRPTSGEVRWCGRLAGKDPGARRLIGAVSHESHLYPHLSLRENLVFAARMYDLPEPARHADRLLEDLGLAPHRDRLPTEISKGMRQRLAVARAVIHDPMILFLDEPFSGLDAEGSDWLCRLLGQLRARGQTICFSAHDPERVRQLADRVLELRTGRAWECDLGAVRAGATSLARAA
ncbi:MAG: ABC transporter ATP-binding protein [Pirellulales bacterium]